jgi:hypothetical protein
MSMNGKSKVDKPESRPGSWSPHDEKTDMRESLKEILGQVDSMPTLDNRSEDEILGYDEHGLPRNSLQYSVTH